jgi:hypothetical protein
MFCSADALASQWIPADPDLWRIENYPAFLTARRRLIAADANAFLGRLVGAEVAWTKGLRPVRVADETDERDARAVQIRDLLTELAAAGYSTPALDTEISDPETSRALAVAEAYWPEGLQAGQGAPVVLELDPEEADLPRLAELGFEVFTSVDALRGFVQRRNELASGDREDEGTGVPGVASEPESEPHPAVAPAESLPVESVPVASGPGEFGPADPPALVPTGADSQGATGAGASHDGEVAQPRVSESAASDTARTTALLEARLVDALDVCKGELKHNPRPFVGLLVEYGPIEAVRRALARPGGDTFSFLWERGRLDLSVEAVMLDERFVELFTEDERAAARGRLEEFGYEVSAA